MFYCPVRVKPDLSPPAPSTRLGDWYASTFNVSWKRLVLCTSERTLLPVLVPIAGLDLPGKLKAALAEFLKAIGVPAKLLDEELRQMSEFAVGKAASLSVLASMNDFKRMSPSYLAEEPSLLHVALKLGEAPCGPMEYRSPIEAALEAFGLSADGAKTPLRWLSRAPAKPKPAKLSDAQYEQMVERATLDAHGDEEQARGWHSVMEEHLKTPFQTKVLGVGATVEQIELQGDSTLVAVCHRGEHRQAIPVLDLPIPDPAPSGAQWLEAYRRWKK